MSALGPIVVVKPIAGSYSCTNPFSGHCVLYPKSDFTLVKGHTLFRTLCVHVPFLLPVQML